MTLRDGSATSRHDAIEAQPIELREPQWAQIGYDGRPPILEPLAGLTARERKARDCPKRNVNHCVVCWLLSQRLISKREHEAAERLQADFEAKAISDMPGVNLMTGGGGCQHGPSTVPQVRVDARKHYEAALSFAGDTGGQWLKAIVVEDLSLTAAAKLMRVHEKGALPALRVALGVLVMVYAFGLEAGHAQRPDKVPAIARGAGPHRAALPGPRRRA